MNKISTFHLVFLCRFHLSWFPSLHLRDFFQDVDWLVLREMIEIRRWGGGNLTPDPLVLRRWTIVMNYSALDRLTTEEPSFVYIFD